LETVCQLGTKLWQQNSALLEQFPSSLSPKAVKPEALKVDQ